MSFLKGGYMGNWNDTQEAYYVMQSDFSEHPEKSEPSHSKLGTEPPHTAGITKFLLVQEERTHI